jgi:hypothetical protein
MNDRLKMYILVKKSVPSDLVPLITAHAAVAGYLEFKGFPDTDDWANPGPFYKTICAVSDDEFERARQVEDNKVMTASELGGSEVAIVFAPRREWPKMFKFLTLWKTKHAAESI